MPITVTLETGASISGANSYIDSAQADAILALEPLDLSAWTSLDVDTKARFIIAATLWLDDHVAWSGKPQSTTQALGWPRKNARDRERRPVADNIVPSQVRRATALIANYLLSNDDADQAGVRRFRSDTFEIEYQQGWYKSPCPSWLKFVLFGLGSPANELGSKKIVR
jgi:hypothetical protein